jgi:uncharacterized protein
MGNPVIHFEVMGKDARLLQDFYRQAFDWEISSPAVGAGPDQPDYAFAVTQSRAGINGGIGAGKEYDGHVTFYVEVPELEAALAKIAHLGGTTRMAPAQVPGGGPRIALFTDPEGHVIGLIQHGDS